LFNSAFFSYKTNVPLHSEEARGANQPDFEAQKFGSVKFKIGKFKTMFLFLQRI